MLNLGCCARLSRGNHQLPEHGWLILHLTPLHLRLSSLESDLAQRLLINEIILKRDICTSFFHATTSACQDGSELECNALSTARPWLLDILQHDVSTAGLRIVGALTFIHVSETELSLTKVSHRHRCQLAAAFRGYYLHSNHLQDWRQGKTHTDDCVITIDRKAGHHSYTA